MHAACGRCPARLWVVDDGARFADHTGFVTSRQLGREKTNTPRTLESQEVRT
jgi:hypothetical protein